MTPKLLEFVNKLVGQFEPLNQVIQNVGNFFLPQMSAEAVSCGSYLYTATCVQNLVPSGICGSCGGQQCYTAQTYEWRVYVNGRTTGSRIGTATVCQDYSNGCSNTCTP